jgi:hypothetical protein
MNTKRWLLVSGLVVVVLVGLMMVPLAFAQTPVSGVMRSVGMGAGFGPGQMDGMMDRQGGRMGMQQADNPAAGPMNGQGRGRGQGQGFVDNDGDGVCDNLGQGGGQGRVAAARGKAGALSITTATVCAIIWARAAVRAGVAARGRALSMTTATASATTPNSPPGKASPRRTPSNPFIPQIHNQKQTGSILKIEPVCLNINISLPRF